MGAIELETSSIFDRTLDTWPACIPARAWFIERTMTASDPKIPARRRELSRRRAMMQYTARGYLDDLLAAWSLMSGSGSCCI